jgi:uncharacterized protein
VKTTLLFIAAIAMTTTLSSAQQAPPSSKPRILVHLTSGPENPTKAALAFLVARTAIEQGHAVSLFLAGDAVQLLRDAALDNVTGLGTGKLRDHFDAIAAGGGRFYLSGMSSNARGITAAELQGKPAELSPPAILLKLALEHDRMFTY